MVCLSVRQSKIITKLSTADNKWMLLLRRVDRVQFLGGCFRGRPRLGVCLVESEEEGVCEVEDEDGVSVAEERVGKEDGMGVAGPLTGCFCEKEKVTINIININ